MDPADRQAATLAALGEQVEGARKLLCAAQRVQLELKEPKILGRRIPGWGWWPDVERMMAALIAQAEGRRSILVRHAPMRFPISEAWCCTHCSRPSAIPPTPWPCPDWRDAAADLGVPDGQAL
jgi:hypothetical protein